MPEATTDLPVVFDRLEALLARYAPPFVRTGSVKEKRHYQLGSERPVEVEGRKRHEVYFAGLIAQKGYVGFYFMPVYTHADQRRTYAPGVLALLRGKSCFHVKRLDETLERDVEDALAHGFELHRERGWVE